VEEPGRRGEWTVERVVTAVPRVAAVANTAAPIGEVIATRRGSGRVKVLLSVQGEMCPHCRAGSWTISVWATWGGSTERISWCRRCFNAQCTRAKLSDEEEAALDLARATIEERGRIRYFDCARHAVEYVQWGDEQ
jgi:hypothetical protein